MMVESQRRIGGREAGGRAFTRGPFESPKTISITHDVGLHDQRPNVIGFKRTTQDVGMHKDLANSNF